jgi:hypothetical protein
VHGGGGAVGKAGPGGVGVAAHCSPGAVRAGGEQ